MNVFFSEFSDLLEETSILSHHIIFLGDLNIHLDEKNNSNSLFFCDIVTSFNLVQHVSEATHESGHLLDLMIRRPTDFVSNVLVGDLFSNHKIHLIYRQARYYLKRSKFILEIIRVLICSH